MRAKYLIHATVTEEFLADVTKLPLRNEVEITDALRAFCRSKYGDFLLSRRNSEFIDIGFMGEGRRFETVRERMFKFKIVVWRGEQSAKV